MLVGRLGFRGLLLPVVVGFARSLRGVVLLGMVFRGFRVGYRLLFVASVVHGRRFAGAGVLARVTPGVRGGRVFLARVVPRAGSGFVFRFGLSRGGGGSAFGAVLPLVASGPALRLAR